MGPNGQAPPEIPRNPPKPRSAASQEGPEQRQRSIGASRKLSRAEMVSEIGEVLPKEGVPLALSPTSLCLAEPVP